MGDIDGERRYGARLAVVREDAGAEAFDLQAGFTAPDAPIAASHVVDAPCARPAALARAAKAAGMLVVDYEIAFPSPFAAPHWKVPLVHDLPIGTPGKVLNPRIAEAEPGVVLAKAARSIFWGTPRAAILTRDGGSTR